MQATRERDEGAWVEAGPVKVGDALRAPLRLPGTLLACRELVRAGVRRELSSRFSGTLLGRLWSFAMPLVLFGVYYFLFTRIFGLRLAGLPESQRAALGVWMFVGTLVWSGFAEGLTRASTVLVENGTLIKKLAFPAEILPLQSVLASTLTQLAGCLVFGVVATLCGLWPPPGADLLWLPLIVVLQVLFAYGLALGLSAATVFVRDTAAALGLVLTLWMFATPVFWMPVPEALPGIEPWLSWIERNPMHSLCYAWRAVLMSGEPALAFRSTIGRELASFAPWALGAVVLGAMLFASTKRRFGDEV